MIFSPKTLIAGFICKLYILSPTSQILQVLLRNNHMLLDVSFSALLRAYPQTLGTHCYVYPTFKWVVVVTWPGLSKSLIFTSVPLPAYLPSQKSIHKYIKQAFSWVGHCLYTAVNWERKDKGRDMGCLHGIALNINVCYSFEGWKEKRITVHRSQ